MQLADLVDEKRELHRDRERHSERVMPFAHMRGRIGDAMHDVGDQPCAERDPIAAPEPRVQPCVDPVGVRVRMLNIGCLRSAPGQRSMRWPGCDANRRRGARSTASKNGSENPLSYRPACDAWSCLFSMIPT